MQLEFGKTEGLDERNASYAVPLNARDTTLRLYYESIDSEVVEDPFDKLDIKSDEETWSLALTQPFYLSPNGHAFQDFDSGGDDIQDDGLSFRLSARLL